MSNDFDKKLLDDVAQHGWHCVQILEDREGPGYSFTVGLFKTHKHPELMVMGLPNEVAHQILGMASEQIARGHVFKADTRDDSLLEGNECLFRTVPSEAYRKYLGYAVWFYKDSPQSFPALQILWPDPDGKFPGEPGFSLGANQPTL
ncbi:DUF4262 domain-containing protein [bacterium]|nr:DUF4262 domain-containing protein [bacterium]